MPSIRSNSSHTASTDDADFIKLPEDEKYSADCYCKGDGGDNGDHDSGSRILRPEWEGGTGLGWTYFGWHLRLRLDHILYSEDFNLQEVKVIDSDLSDHKPLLARFK